VDRFAADLWIETRPMRFWGVETGTRMTVVRLSGGGLFVHSPVALHRETKAAVDALGPVVAVVAPSRFHHLFVAEWRQAYPGAIVCACPGLERKRPDVAWDRVLGDAPEGEWAGELDPVFFGARSLENEVVFFHRPSGTLVCADFLFNLARHPSPLTRLAALLLGQRAPGATILERVLIRDRAKARAEVARIRAWDAERIVLGHGDLIEHGGGDVVERAYRWL
jgi:hypothetical protein